MAPSDASFVTPRPSAAGNAAFGGVFELSQLLVHGDDSMPVLCLACRTINRASATVCKGCDGKLPAYFTSGGEAEAPAPASVPAVEAIESRRGRRLRRRIALLLSGPWSTVICIAAVLLLLYAGFALWYAAHSVSAAPRRVEPAAAPAPVLLAAPRPALPPAPVSEVNVVRTADALNVTLSGTARPAEAASASAPRREVQRKPPARPAAAAPTRQPVAVRAGAAGPLAQCFGLNVLARAICMNDRCAERVSARHPQCAPVLRQRRIDEARRNLFN